jgi:FHS family glucose/mannose:H+ symporter-like MFS transporter
MVSVSAYPGVLQEQLETVSARRRTLAAVFLYFPIAGVATVMLGPVLPVLAARWGMSDAQLGTLFFASFIGQFCGAWFAARRLGTSLLFAALGASAGCGMLAYAGPVSAHFALLCMGLGLGAGLTAGNVIVGTVVDANAGGAERNSGGHGSQRSRLLAVLNISWGIGAIACPVMVGASLRLHRFDGLWMSLGFRSTSGGQLFFLGLAVAFALCAVFVVWLLPRSAYRRTPIAASGGRVPVRVLWLFVATVVLYVGVENALGGWLPLYADRLAGMGSVARRASSIALCFWIAELAGRVAMALVVRRVNERIFYQTALLVLIGATGALLLVPHLSTVGVFLITAIAALSLAPLFPLAISFLLARAGKDPRLGRIFASSSLGGTSLPWLTGIVSTQFQSLRVGLAVPAIGAVLMLLLSIDLPRGGGES